MFQLTEHCEVEGHGEDECDEDGAHVVIPPLEADLPHVQEMVEVEEAPRLKMLGHVGADVDVFRRGVLASRLQRPVEEVEHIQDINHQTGAKDLERNSQC